MIIIQCTIEKIHVYLLPNVIILSMKVMKGLSSTEARRDKELNKSMDIVTTKCKMKIICCNSKERAPLIERSK